jgi:peptidoglycan/xylan/chitin deacetylase (PgdA/CDA1 family)/glycosyltransferase involved in cell wall biosynthesis
MKKVSVSIVVSAHHSAITISETLESIIAQTFSNWEVIVVNDRADAEIAKIVTSFAAQDARIRLVNQPDQGVCMARNTGIDQANFDWLLFIDAGDWILPTHLERLTDILAANPQVDFAYSGWARVTSDQQPYGPPECPTVSGDLFDLLAEGNPFAIHGCVVRRSLVEAVGKFDPALKNHADWDLWQRIARTGAYFGGTEEVLARDRIGFSSKSAMFLRQQWFSAMGRLDATPFGQELRRLIYKMTVTLVFQAIRVIYSLRQNQPPIILGMFTDAMQVLAQGHRADPRVLTPHPNHAQGKSTERLPALELGLACTYAGLAIGAGEDFRPILAQLRDDYEIEAISMELMKPFLYALPVPTCHPLSAYHYLWDSLEQPINQLALALEQHLKIPAFARRACLNMERGILEHAVASRPITLGPIYAIQVELTQPLPDISAPDAAERLHCTVTLAEERLGFLELPIFNRMVASHVLADAIAAEFAEIILKYASENQFQALERSLNLQKTRLELSLFSNAEKSETFQLPILMYHHVAPTGSAKFTRWRVTPEAFEAQLRCLQDAGAYSITLEEWRTALMAKTPLPGKPVIITFDDGYLDFATYAWPVLKRYGFSATVFIVADFAGQTNRWDRIFDYGEDLAILNWEQIRQLRAEGVEFGSHTLNHYPLTSLSPVEVVREAAQSRAIIERELGIPITTFAYPYGDLDSVVQRLIGTCGYDIAVSCRPGYSSFQDPLLQLARIEIEGTDSLEEFENKLFPLCQEVTISSVAAGR